MKDHTISQALRQAIHEQLQQCSPATTPALYARIQTTAGYRELEAQIIAVMIAQQITPATALALLESELS
jgi:hypothetical protein